MPRYSRYVPDIGSESGFETESGFGFEPEWFGSEFVSEFASSFQFVLGFVSKFEFAFRFLNFAFLEEFSELSNSYFLP